MWVLVHGSQRHGQCSPTSQCFIPNKSPCRCQGTVIPVHCHKAIPLVYCCFWSPKEAPGQFCLPGACLEATERSFGQDLTVFCFSTLDSYLARGPPGRFIPPTAVCVVCSMEEPRVVPYLLPPKWVLGGGDGITETTEKSTTGTAGVPACGGRIKNGLPLWQLVLATVMEGILNPITQAIDFCCPSRIYGNTWYNSIEIHTEKEITVISPPITPLLEMPPITNWSSPQPWTKTLSNCQRVTSESRCHAPSSSLASVPEKVLLEAGECWNTRKRLRDPLSWWRKSTKHHTHL